MYDGRTYATFFRIIAQSASKLEIADRVKLVPVMTSMRFLYESAYYNMIQIF
jgi:hypothetical protein